MEYGASIEAPSTISNMPIKKKTVLLVAIKSEIIKIDSKFNLISCYYMCILHIKFNKP